MKKIMLLPALCFVLCLGLVFWAQPETPDTPAPESSVQPQAQPQTEPDAPPFIVPPENPAPTPPVQGASPQDQPSGIPQPMSLPLTPEHEDFYRKFFPAITNTSPPNKELQTYRPEQVSIVGNRMTLTADQKNGHYVSGRVESFFSFLYGSITFRFKPIANPGLFPAVWMLPAQSLPYPEVDIYESIGREPQHLYGVMHYLELPSDLNSKTRNFFQHTYPSHTPLQSSTIRFDWTPDSLVWYLDGAPIYSIVENVPQIPMYLIFNLAVGGTWCGDPTPETVWPSAFEVEILEFKPQQIFTR